MPAFAGFLDLLVGELVRAGCDQVVVLQPEPGEQVIERLGAVVPVVGAFVFGVHRAGCCKLRLVFARDLR